MPAQTIRRFRRRAERIGLRQVNVLADAHLAPGRYCVQAEFGGVRSAEFEIEATLP